MAALVHHVQVALLPTGASAISNAVTLEAPVRAYLGKHLYDVRSGRFDPVGLRRERLERELTPEQLAAEAGVARSSVYKAQSGKGVRDRIATAILGALYRHPRSLPPLD